MENRPKFKTAEKKKMLLSDETLLGLRMTCKGHVYLCACK